MTRVFVSGDAVEDFYQEVSQRIPDSNLANVPDVGDRRDLEVAPNTDFPDVIDWPEVYQGQGPIEMNPFDENGIVSEQMEKTFLSDDETSEFHGRVRIEGFDFAAFYKSRRYRDREPYKGRWGIFYLDRGIRYLSDVLRSSVPAVVTGTIPPPTSAHGPTPVTSTHEWSHRFLQKHERYHFRFDFYALGVEAVAGRAMYDRLSHAFRRHPSHLVEEALANAAAYRWARQGHNGRVGLSAFARDYLRLQPNAYGRFQEPDLELRAELAANLLDLDLRRSARRHDQAGWVAEIPKHFRQCPEYLVLTTGRARPVRPALRMPSVRSVVDDEKVTKYLQNKPVLNAKWQSTKAKLLSSPALPGLNFKPWRPAIVEWSVRVDEGNRAHLRQIDTANAVWQAINIGTHTEMGHD